MPRILVATATGLHTFDEDRHEHATEHDGHAVSFVAQDGAELWAVLGASELWRTADVGWRHVTDLPDLKARCVAATNHGVLVGSSEARLFRVSGSTAVPEASFDRAEGRGRWHTPWGGPPDTRSISEWDDDVYVNVHVGGILRSDDAGASWVPTIDIDADVHQVATAEGLVLAACAGGLAISRDRGATWTLVTDGLGPRYSRAVTVAGGTVLISTSAGPRGGDAGVYRGPIGGPALERCTQGLPSSFDDNVDTSTLDAMPREPFVAFGTSDGRVFLSEDEGVTWSELASGLSPIRRVLVLP